MAIISGDVPNLINGVSQQPDRTRLPSQAELQVNCLSSVVYGLRKRPPLLHVAKLLNSVSDNPFIHFYDRDVTERYCVVITNDDLKVFDVDGAEKTVTFPDGKGYLTSTDPRSDFKAITVADYTFIVNTGTTVTKTATKSASRNPEALVYINQSTNGKRFSVFLNGTEVWVETSTGGENADLGTDTIMDALAGGANLTGTNSANGASHLEVASFAGFTFTQYGNVIHITRGTAFTLTTNDGLGGEGVKMVMNEVQNFSDLPKKAHDGFVCKVRGDSTTDFDDYWVTFRETGGSGTGEGVWEETVEPNTDIELDDGTMPHQLVRQSNGTFIFQEATWAQRLKGGLDKNPFPSFLDTEIKDVFFWKNRLGFLADENAILSEDGEFFNFFRTTVVTLLDSDPVDTSNINTKVSLLQHAVPLNEQLVLFAENQQFILESGAGNIITPGTASIDQSTTYHTSKLAKPIPIGSRIFFAGDKSQATSVREYVTDIDSGLNEAYEVTDHVPVYIPTGVFKLAGTVNENIVVAIPANNSGSLYVYQYYFQGANKLQSAWHRWDFGSGAEIHGADFIEGTLYVVSEYSDGLFLEKIECEEGYTDVGITFAVNLDRRVDDTDCAVSYSAGTGLTTITLPFNVTGTVCAVAKSGQTEELGRILGADTLAGTAAFTVSGDMSAVSMWIGIKYTSEYKFSKFYVRAQRGNSQVSDTRNPLHLQTLMVDYEDTGYFRAEVTHNDFGTYTYVMPGRFVGSADSLIGGLAIDSGQFEFPIAGRNEEITVKVINDTHLPMRLLSASWLGEVTPLSRRV